MFRSGRNEAIICQLTSKDTMWLSHCRSNVLCPEGASVARAITAPVPVVAVNVSPEAAMPQTSVAVQVRVMRDSPVHVPSAVVSLV